MENMNISNMSIGKKTFVYAEKGKCFSLWVNGNFCNKDITGFSNEITSKAKL